jgi:DNA (cytosine-5)-methyltransferase 1
MSASFTSLDFFAGSGLVRLGLEPHFRAVWANDIDRRKEAVYRSNFGADAFRLGSIEDVRGASLPQADLAWASFPCQDLSLAGSLGGMKEGTRSGLFWHWLRVLDELAATGRRPPLLVAENVVGFVVARQGRDFRTAYFALRDRGYRLGALIIDARLFVPQSRPRAFLIAISDEIETDGLTQRLPSPPFHPDSLMRTALSLADPDWIWWTLPTPSIPPPSFVDLCERDAPCDAPEKTRALERLLSPVNRRKLKIVLESGGTMAGTGYRRTRPGADGRRVQRLEIRFDGVAGCLRTPEGGSSRQVVMIVDRGELRTRLMTVRECARLMGTPDWFQVPGSYNDGYRAMGDAVVAPVTQWMTEHLLAPLAARASAGVLRNRTAAPTNGHSQGYV